MGRPRGGRGPPGESRNEAPSRSPASLVEGPPSMEDLRLDHSASSLSRLASFLFPPRVFSSAALLPPPPPPALLGPALVRTRSIHLLELPGEGEVNLILFGNDFPHLFI